LLHSSPLLAKLVEHKNTLTSTPPPPKPPIDITNDSKNFYGSQPIYLSVIAKSGFGKNDTFN
jgi:hypothetical protein